MSPTDKISEKIISQFAKQMRKEGLYAAGCGGGESGGKINSIDICFEIYQVMDMENARALIVETSNSLLEQVNSNYDNSSYFIQFPIPIELLSISIIGQEPNRSCDYIKMVSLIQGKIHYCKDDPERKIMPFIKAHVETFDEAVQILAEQERCEPCS